MVRAQPVVLVYYVLSGSEPDCFLMVRLGCNAVMRIFPAPNVKIMRQVLHRAC